MASKKSGGKFIPIALIIRFNEDGYENSEPENITANTVPDVNSSTNTAVTVRKEMSYLMIMKITPNEICIIDKVKPIADANVKARQIADEAISKPCLKEDNKFEKFGMDNKSLSNQKNNNN